MKTPDQEVLEKLLVWLEEKRPSVLVTVLETWGSSPRAPGSLMCITQNGEFEGSVSGGCVEADLIEKIHDYDFNGPKITTIRYGVNGDQALIHGLPCGGQLLLALEIVNDSTQIEQILSSINRRQTIERVVDLYCFSSKLRYPPKEQNFEYNDKEYRKVFGPVWRLIIVGAGQLSKYLAQMALPLGYQIIVCDPREEYVKLWRVENTLLDTRMPDEVVSSLGDDLFSAIVTLTHDPKLDDMALMEALDSKAFYVGALGSNRNNAKRKLRLSTLGVSDEGLKRLHGPVRLAIGSHTPPEIAISILAEITAYRNGAMSIGFGESKLQQGVKENSYA